MTSFDTSPQLNVWRALLALAVVFVMLATTGWTALRNQRGATPLQASLSAWEHGRIGGTLLPDRAPAPDAAGPLLRLAHRAGTARAWSAATRSRSAT